MNKIILGLVCALIAFVLLTVSETRKIALAEYQPGQITVTAVSNTNTASSGYLITGSMPGQKNIWSVGLSDTRAFQIWPADYSSTILYAYSSSPTAWAQWPAAYGPLQIASTLPNGIWVALTPTSGTVNVYFDSYH
jgi:hypothetical protein